MALINRPIAPKENPFRDDKKYNSSKEWLCVICNQVAKTRAHHILSVGSHGRIDTDWNLIPLVFDYHREFHDNGVAHMVNKYPAVKAWMLEKGWECYAYKWRHEKYEES